MLMLFTANKMQFFTESHISDATMSCTINHFFLHFINPLNAELIPIYHLLALLGAHHILHVSRIRFKGDIFIYVQTLKLPAFLVLIQKMSS